MGAFKVLVTYIWQQHKMTSFFGWLGGGEAGELFCFYWNFRTKDHEEQRPQTAFYRDMDGDSLPLWENEADEVYSMIARNFLRWPCSVPAAFGNLTKPRRGQFSCRRCLRTFNFFESLKDWKQLWLRRTQSSTSWASTTKLNVFAV